MDMPAEPNPSNLDTASSLIRRLEDVLPDDDAVTVGYFLQLLGVHGFAFFILVLGILNIAIFMLPGLSILFGIPMVIMAVQMLLGHVAPVFPDAILSQHIKGDMLCKGLHVAARIVETIEIAVKPRLMILTHPMLLRGHFLAALIFAFMVAIPVPFINIPPTVGIILLTIGLMQRDGIFIIVSYVFGIWSLWLYESLGRAVHFVS
jgi:hypothetical protein